jgi:hypothetical protein
MKYSDILLLCFIVFMIICGYAFVLNTDMTTPPTTIRTHHRLTPRLELVIDSGRVDTIYVYKVERK